MPGDDAGEAENLWDTFAMIENNPAIVSLIMIYIFSVCTYNVFGMMVTKSLSSVHRTMLEASRTAVVHFHFYHARDSNKNEKVKS